MSAPYETHIVSGLAIPIYRSVLASGAEQFTVVYRVAKGHKRQKRSFVDVERARVFAAGVPDLIADAGKVQVDLTGEPALVYQRAMRAARQCKMTLDRVVEDFAWMVEKLGERSPVEAVRQFIKMVPECCPPISMHDLQEMYLAEAKRSCAHATFKSYRMRTRGLVRFLREKGGADVKVSEVTTPVLRSWSERPGDSLRELDKRRGTCVRLFEFARSRGYLPADVSTVAERIPKAPRVREHEVPSIFRPEEVERLIAALWPHRRRQACRRRLLYLTIGCFAGVRPQEIMRLTWRNIEMDRGKIFLPGRIAKTRCFREVPIEPNLRAFLLALKPAEETVPLVPKNVSWMLSILARSLGIVWKYDGMRHSYGTYRLARGDDAGVITQAMGNSVKILWNHYRGRVVDDPDVARYWNIYPPGRVE